MLKATSTMSGSAAVTVPTVPAGTYSWSLLAMLTKSPTVKLTGRPPELTPYTGGRAAEAATHDGAISNVARGAVGASA